MLRYLFLLILISITNQRKLLQIQQVFRHGARNSQSINPYDNSQISQKWNSPGQLTSQGKFMHYTLGKEIYKKYWKLLFSGTPYQNVYNQSKIYVKSTNTNRTIESALSHLLGLYQNLQPLVLNPSAYQYSLPQWPNLNSTAPTTDWLIFNNVAPQWHPTVVHSEQQSSNSIYQGDFLLSSDADNCPNQNYYASINMQSQQGKQIQSLPQVTKFIEQLKKQLKYQGLNFDNVDDFIDNYMVLKHLQQPYLKIFDNPSFTSTINFIYCIKLYLGRYYTQTQRKLGSTRFLYAILENMKKIISNTKQRQIIIYSGHDTSIAPLVAAFNMTNVDCIYQYWIGKIDNRNSCIVQFPQYASNIVFQLWEEDNKTHTLKILYNGIERAIPICQNKISCDFNNFQKWVQSYATSDYFADCGIQIKSNVAIIITFVAIIVTLLIGFGIYIFTLKKKINKNSQENNILAQENPKE